MVKKVKKSKKVVDKVKINNIKNNSQDFLYNKSSVKKENSEKHLQKNNLDDNKEEEEERESKSDSLLELAEILNNILSTDNTIRLEAEELFESMKSNIPKLVSNLGSILTGNIIRFIYF